MVKLRLARYGKRGQPFYRVVAIDDRKKREGPALEVVGTYNPLTKPATIILKKERIEYWLKMGAQMTETVRNLTKFKLQNSNPQIKSKSQNSKTNIL